MFSYFVSSTFELQKLGQTHEAEEITASRPLVQYLYFKICRFCILREVIQY